MHRSTPGRDLRSIAGMTLLEVLVVLVLVGLITAAAFDGISTVFDLRRRLGLWVDLAGDNAISASWLRSSLSGLVPEYENGTHPFRGSEYALTGMTLTGFNSRAGIPVSLEWRFGSDGQESTLEYQDSTTGGFRSFWRWKGERGHFTYIGEDGKAYSDWPPQSLIMPTGAALPQLPSAIRVDFGGPLGKLSIYAALITMKDADKLITPMGTPLQ